MTSDAKVGLLLGLVFIFLIAFVINGLPNFLNKTNNSELTTEWAQDNNNGLGLAENQRKMSKIIREPVRLTSRRPAQTENKTTDNIRLERELPKKPAEQPVTKVVAIRKDAVTRKTVNSKRPKLYTISEGDSLASIAKKFYGQQQGNKMINIERIFKANKSKLKSSDKICIGQELVIPPLPDSYQDKNKIEGVFPRTMFKPVASVSKSVLLPNKNKPATKNTRLYTVKETDSLWRIAAKQLGNGTRYTEIAKLNTNILDGEEGYIEVGMQLKIPAK